MARKKTSQPEQKVALHPKQAEAFMSPATEILYGGAAGGGKSHLMRIVAIFWAFEIAGIQIYIFRRTRPDLYKNHMNGPTSFPMLIAPWIADRQVKINNQDGEITFANGSKIHLCHCQYEHDVTKYQGAEIHILLIDELTHFTENQYRFLRSRVRLGGYDVSVFQKEDYPFKLEDKFPFIMSGSNPGGEGHQWVKTTFVDFAQPMQLVQAPDEEGGKIRQFIPARLQDNPSMRKTDPNYAKSLAGLGNPDLVKAMLEGDWNITYGTALEKLTRDKHCLRKFKVPEWWTRFMVIDWGYSAPFAIGWFCVCDEDLELKGKGHWPDRFIPEGSVIMYRELYGWNGRPNEGIRMDASEVADMILEIEDAEDEEMDYRVGDSQMWATDNGPSVMTDMMESSGNRLFFYKCKKNRIANYQRVRSKIEGMDGFPGFYVTESCTHFWRTVPTLQLDELNPDKGPDTKAEDHIYDVVAYAFSTKPQVITRKMRAEIEREEVMSHMDKKRSRGRYATG